MRPKIVEKLRSAGGIVRREDDFEVFESEEVTAMAETTDDLARAGPRPPRDSDDLPAIRTRLPGDPTGPVPDDDATPEPDETQDSDEGADEN